MIINKLGLTKFIGLVTVTAVCVPIAWIIINSMVPPKENKTLVSEPQVFMTSVPTATILPTATQLPTVRPTKKLLPTATPVMQPRVSAEEINRLIDRFSGEFGVDPNVIRHLTLCESQLDQFARNGIHTGLFQFAPDTWSYHRKVFGQDPNPDLRFNAQEAISTAVHLVAMGRRDLWPNCMP